VSERDAALDAGADFVPGFGDIGLRLRGARERAGLSVAQVAEKMHCDLRLVEALDAGRFTQLGAPVYARGHIRRYAELLGEPVGEILERWDREAAGHVAPPDLTRIPKAKRSPDTRRLLLPVAVAAVIALFALLISWVLRDSTLPTIGGLELPTETVGAPTDIPPVAVPADAVPADAAPAAPVGAPATPAAAPAEAVVAPLPAAASAPAVVTTPAATRTVALALRARSDCWIEIYGPDRRQLYFGLLRRGAATSVSGKGPLQVLLGNVGGVAIEVNGQGVVVPRELQRNNTAYVRVAADGTFSANPRD
jgi:cytoskeleton protein RodZ